MADKPKTTFDHIDEFLSSSVGIAIEIAVGAGMMGGISYLKYLASRDIPDTILFSLHLAVVLGAAYLLYRIGRKSARQPAPITREDIAEEVVGRIQQLWPEITPETAEYEIDKWIDRFRLTNKKEKIDGTIFATIITLDNDKAKILTYRPSTMDQYIVVQCELGFEENEYAFLSAQPLIVALDFEARIKVEISKLGFGYEVVRNMPTKPKKMPEVPMHKIVISKRTPIRGLSEAVFMESLNDIENVLMVAASMIVFGLKDLGYDAKQNYVVRSA